MTLLRALVLGLAVAAGASCAVNKWGDICQSNADCDDAELICKKVSEDNTSGFCHYPDEIACGLGTVLEEQGNEFACVPDPESPPQVTCGDGTVEENGACVPE